ncbi:hypothetical protein E1294_45480 [Nonomuraea diastatica]|uniref:Uncharacterized protein n=1 Tax=Nonomuraea diastatica TaxID=1848329 RepID=A0A4R4W057_9ACTN|nr:hypothetical protein E1294_45480 [Nonomuraea diastatica]
MRTTSMSVSASVADRELVGSSRISTCPRRRAPARSQRAARRCAAASARRRCSLGVAFVVPTGRGRRQYGIPDLGSVPLLD